MRAGHEITVAWIQSLLDTVTDPEIPILSVTDLGIIREVQTENGWVRISITPTYSGCPAMDLITRDIQKVLRENGMDQVEIRSVISPAWTTDWMSESGKKKLREYGIAPPHSKQMVCTPDAFQREESIQCPHCRSFKSKLVSQFGSTPCKALYQCESCREPFEYFKCH